MTTIATLQQKNCVHTKTALTPVELEGYLALLTAWQIENAMITRSFSFNNYHTKFLTSVLLE